VDELLVADVMGWRAWLDEYEDSEAAVYLVLARKGRLGPTTLTYAEALDEALCSGWIDGHARSRDADTTLRRFTPRRPRSNWSARNIGIVTRLEAEGRLRPRGQAEIARAKANGHWEGNTV